MALPCDAIQAADRYSAWLDDGSRLTARAIPSWPVPGIPYRFQNHDLLASGNPVRLVKDRQAVVELKTPYVAFANGDVVTGRPMQLDLERSGVGTVPRVKLQLDPPLMPVDGTGVNVRTDRIRRIVASSAADRKEPSPGTVELADGRRLMARSIRWKEYGLSILTSEGVVEALYGDLVDVVFPVEASAAVVDDNLWAGGAAGAAIARFQMTGGSVVTASRISREQERTSRRRRVAIEVYYYVQPAWADQPISLAEPQIAWCSYRGADEAPLSLFSAEGLVNQRLIGTAEPWLTNSGVGGGLLGAANLEADIGVITHSHSELAFDLPVAARSLEMSVGLERSVGDGGCVRCLVVTEALSPALSQGEREKKEALVPALSQGARENARQVLWDSGIVQGSDGLQRTGPIDVTGLPRVILVTEYAHEGRPEGADPFDIRDRVAWLNPLVKLDLAEGSGQASRVQALLGGVADWELVGDGWRDLSLAGRWNLTTMSWDTVATLPRSGELRLKRQLQVGGGDVIELRTTIPKDLAEHELELTVNGQPRAWITNADRARLRYRNRDDDARFSDQLAYWWDLSPWRGQSVTLELSLRGQRDRNEVAWRGLLLRSAIAGSGGQAALKPDWPLTSLEPLAIGSRESYEPLKNAVPVVQAGEPIRFLGQTFTGGYGMRRNSHVSFALRPEFRKFVAVAGCSVATAGPLQVLIDDRVVWARPVLTNLAPAEQIEIDIPAEAKVLTLQTGREGPSYGCAAWAEAGFVE